MLHNELIRRRMRLEKLKKEIMKEIKYAPDGNLRVVNRKSGVQYYHITEKGDTQGHYLRKAEREKVHMLAQKGYSIEMLAAIENEIRAIEDAMKYEYSDDSLGKIYDGMNEYRKALVRPYVLSDEEYVKQWESEIYKGKGFTDDATEHYTDKGERVRSKSEVDLANIFNELHIPYKYEHPIIIDDTITVYPDFTFLNVSERKECYLEHFGMMDDPGYLKTEFFLKMNSYIRNGYIPGINLFMTFESKANPLNKRDARKYIAAIAGTSNSSNGYGRSW